ncbi:MAG TPA: methyltransferase domain-containing protein [Actinomycetota bacterium]|nr:methyltransferase domain-containing protein [Actinomycetota bacterium]
MEDAAPYVLGHSPIELDRLERQARIVDPITRRFVQEAGVRPGMRVLDVGSGAGDVALLLADLVGPNGGVVGFDRSAAGLEAARSKAAVRGVGHVTFVTGTIDAVDDGEPFDAAVGRCVLQFQSDPAELLAAVAARVTSGGLVVFRELDWSGVSSEPAIPTFERLCDWVQRAIAESGANVHSGLRLPAVFAAAGLEEPELRLEQPIGVGEGARKLLEKIADLATTLATTIIERGIATAEDLDLETLLARMTAEAAERRSLVRSHLQIGAWSRV